MIRLAGIAALCLGAAPWPAHAQEQPEAANNGTDPTKFITTAAAIYEYNDLIPGMSRHAPRLEYIQPFGGKRDYQLRVQLPMVSNDVAGNDGFGLGDIAVRLGHVFGVTREHGMVVQGEMIFDTASRDELGTGQNVFKGTFIYARFLPGGIFAPAIVHSVDVWGDSDRAGVNSTTLDFYYVPRFEDPRNFMTLDPALTSDWHNDRQFASLAVTLGRTLGQAFGGNWQLYAKPTVFAGAERPGDWSIEVGYKVLGF
ncbi:hypothetical protein WQ53_02450 [Pseudoxanthomonas suwonensis]|uniref:Transporter n=2 Tax=Pseudoxanthomonas suwonensis TaxID=314722 RepID=A0A0E3YZ45_9GAMM|nr:hypothetical protein WQ53_02450 [Pseudoxanthomonas suwonensis]